MGDSGRYYWLKLKRDFFKRHDIEIIESMENGKDYLIFYLKLLCESVDHEGSLRFNDQIPYNLEMLSTITKTNVDIVRSAVKLFSELNMMEIWDDGTFYMTQVQKMIGSAANNDNAIRQQRFRDKKKAEALPERYVGVTNSNESKSKNKSKNKIESIEEYNEKSEVDYQLIADLFNGICVSYPKVTRLSQRRKDAIKARLKDYSLEDFKEMFEKAEASDFLKGRNDKKWAANFDWLIKDANMAKVMDGNYDNRGMNDGSTGTDGEAVKSKWNLRADVG